MIKNIIYFQYPHKYLTLSIKIYSNSTIMDEIYYIIYPELHLKNTKPFSFLTRFYCIFTKGNET